MWLFWCSVFTDRFSLPQVDFDAPLGYKEPERRPQHQEEPTVWTLNPKSVIRFLSPQHCNTTLFFCVGGGTRSEQLCWYGHRIQSEYLLMSHSHVSMRVMTGTCDVRPFFRLSPALAIVWMVKRKGSSPAPLLLLQVTLKGWKKRQVLTICFLYVPSVDQ